MGGNQTHNYNGDVGHLFHR